MSYMSGESIEVAASLMAARQVREATGENPLPSVKLWPVKLIDAARLLHVEQIKETNARLEAEESERE